MAKLPRRESLGGLPRTPSVPIARYDVTAIGRGVSDLGRSISRIGADLAEHHSAAEKYDTEARYQEFKWNQKQTLDQSMFETAPDQINGFSDRWLESYGENAKQFFDTVPDSLKNQYHAKLKSTEQQYFRDASQFMRGEQKRSALNRLGDMKASYIQRIQSGAPLEEIRNDYTGLVAANPYLSEIDKAEILRKDLGEMEVARIQSRWENAVDPDAVMRDLGGVLLDTDENPELRAQPAIAASNDNLARPVTSFSSDVNDAITKAAQDENVNPQLLSTFARIESGGKSGARSGSYKGLFQLSKSEFEKYGGGDIYDAGDNARAAARKLRTESETFEKKYGRAPTPIDLYLINQQGEGGYAAHVANPDAPAWENMYSTTEGQQKGEKWAKQAIWGNIPDDVKSQFPDGVESVTSADFIRLWGDKVKRFGDGADTAVVTLPSTYKGPYQNIPPAARMELMQKFQEDYRNQRRAASILTGTLPVDPGDKQDRETIDKAFESTRVLDNLENQDWEASDYVARLAQSTSYIPSRAMGTLRGMAVNGTVDDRHYAYQTLGRIMRERPGALQTSGGENFNKDLADEVETFNTLVMDVGISPEQAISRIDEMRSPQFKARQDSLRAESNEIVKDLSIEDLTKEYSGWFASRPSAGGSDRRASFMLDAYRDMVRYHYIRSGDVDLAKKIALNEMKKNYDVSEVTGNKRLMHNRPENFYPQIQSTADDDPSYEYFQEELKRSVNEAAGRLGAVEPGTGMRAETGLDQIPLEDIYIEANSKTFADIAAGNPYPSYGVVWRQEDEDGIPTFMSMPRNFYVDVKAAQARQAAIRRTALAQEREAAAQSRAELEQKLPRRIFQRLRKEYGGDKERQKLIDELSQNRAKLSKFLQSHAEE